jgi:hypothetical protein
MRLKYNKYNYEFDVEVRIGYFSYEEYGWIPCQTKAVECPKWNNNISLD